jgi:soluble lytic murein transglycosylase-like protein
MDRNYLKLIGIFSLMLVVLLVVVLPVRADIYRYIDENGVMHFTNTPTSSIQKYRIYLKEKPRVIQRYSSSEKYDDLISDASERHGVSFPLLKAIIKAESDFDPHVVSKKGATGLMQIMPENFKPLGIRDPFDPWQNINAGARYFKQMYDRFKGRLALSLAAYNAGPSAVDYYKTIPPYEETEEYVRRVMKYYYNYKNL